MKAKRQGQPVAKPAAEPAAKPAAEPPALTDEGAAIVALAAHELKNALGGIGVALARCDQKLKGGTAVTTEDIAVARGEVRRLSALVNDLLDGARVDLGDVHVQTAPLEITALTREVVEMFQAARERPVTLELPEHAVMIAADSERLRAVLVNYLENAYKYAPAPAPITVTVGEVSAGGPVRIAVRDEGPGIDPVDQLRLFQRFVRIPAVTRRTQGLGLGLYLCRAIAEAHGGAAGVDSVLGQGATFWIEIPPAAPQPVAG